MKKKKRNDRYLTSTYKVYGEYPIGNYWLNVYMNNDKQLYDYVSKNHKALSKLPKKDIIRIIKSQRMSNYARDDLRRINCKNTRSKDLKKSLRDFMK